MSKKRESPILGTLLEKIAPRIGASVFIEPVWKIVGQITFKNGKKSYFRYSTLDLNPMGASEIARDKDYANFFMQKMGYPTIEGKTFYSDAWGLAIGEGKKRNSDAAYRYSQKLGFPVIVKPNSGSQGTGVALVYTKQELYTALRKIFMHDRVALVQRPVVGKDYRIVVLDTEIISAYERIPLNVIGDGISTIEKLLQKKQKDFIASSRDTRINNTDPRIILKLKRKKLSLQSIPALGQQVFLLDNANLSTGGDAIDITHHIHPEFKKICIALTRDMGLRLCGVDLMIRGDITQKPAEYWVIEINSAPGLDHYVKTGKAQQAIVEDMYLTVLKHLEGGGIG